MSYDPIKAHEYYMKHRKLKGRRRSTKGFSKEQKQRYTEARVYLQNERKQNNAADRQSINDDAKEQIEMIREAKRAQKEALAKQTQAKIDQIRQRLKAGNMSPLQKKAVSAKVKNIISNIREAKSAKIQNINATASKQSESVRADAREEKKKATAKNQKEYEKALDKAYKKIKG